MLTDAAAPRECVSYMVMYYWMFPSQNCLRDFEQCGT